MAANETGEDIQMGQNSEIGDNPSDRSEDSDSDIEVSVVRPPPPPSPNQNHPRVLEIPIQLHVLLFVHVTMMMTFYHQLKD